MRNCRRIKMAIQLHEIGIDSCYIQIKDASYFCRLIDIKENTLQLITNTELPKDEIVHFFYRTDDIYYSVVLQEAYYTRDYTHYYEFMLTEPFIASVQAKIDAYVQREDALEKRKEERFDVGLEHYARFGLNSAEQHVFYNTHRFPCFLKNISLHGAQIISTKIPKITAKQFVSLYLQLEKPTETLVQQALVLRIDAQTHEFNAYSLQIFDPEPIWKNRLHAFITQKNV